MLIVDLYAYRATDPKVMLAASDPVGEISASNGSPQPSTMSP
jgi:hypothetical protein